MSILWKLILAIGGPLAVLLGALLAVDYVRLRDAAYRQTEQRMSETAERYAARFDGELRAIAQVARSTAAFLEANPDLAETALYELLRRNVESDPLIYGSCIAFEPGAFRPRAGRREADGGLQGPGAAAPASDGVSPPAPGLQPLLQSPVPPRERGEPGRPNPDLFCPYVYRGSEGLLRMDVAEAYDYLDPRWEWYRVPRETGRAFWTEPFFDEGAGDVEMVTYVAPFFRDGAFRGTVNVDVRLSDLRRHGLVSATGRAGGAGAAELYILSREGSFILAPTPAISMQTTVFRVAEIYGRPDFAALGERMVAGDRGSRRVPSLVGDLPCMAFYAPIESAGWSMGGLVLERDIMAPVYAVLRERLAFGLLVVGAILAIVVGMSTWLTRPVGRLAAAVGELSAGNLEARADVRSGDEIGRLAAGFDRMVGQLREHVAALTRETAARQAAESELRVARAIQASMLPGDFPSRPEYELYALNAPARFVGGDFFDYVASPGGELTVAVADVSGKGVAAAMLMAVTRTLLRGLAMNNGLAGSPGDLLARANGILQADNAESMFVTVLLAVYEPRTGRVRYANAGHPAPFRVDASGRVEVFGGPTGTILGVLEGERFGERSLTLGAGEALVFYTDGVPEARSRGGEFFGMHRFRDLLSAGAGLPARELCEAVLRRVEEFQGGEPHDDVTVLVLRRLA